jgi:hypothetical protein
VILSIVVFFFSVWVLSVLHSSYLNFDTSLVKLLSFEDSKVRKVRLEALVVKLRDFNFS